MFGRENNIAIPTDEIASYLESNRTGYRSLRRRAVIYKTAEKWQLQACVVEGFTVNREIVKEAPREYSQVVLFEDWLTLIELREFISQIQEGWFSLGEYLLDANNYSCRWTKERLPLSNDYMTYAGYVWSSQFHDPVNGVYGELLAPKQPYYPNLHEAVKDWLPFPVYHGSSDVRKGEVILLLPETRAYFEDATPHEDTLDLRIAGAGVNNFLLEVKGAWWNEEGIHHFTEAVKDGRALLNIPHEADRLDYVLMDTSGTVYDFQQEDGHRHTGLGRKRKNDKNRSLANIVREACLKGEGPKIEFKPFLYLDNDKLLEAIKTVVAFANASGGRIFLGISDGCEVAGINEQLQTWAKAEANEAACIRYLGEIRGRIRDKLQSDVQIDFSQVPIDGRWIAIIEVGEANDKPITIRQDKNLYFRRGSSNTKASPEEWKAIISSPGNIGMASWLRNY